MLSFSHKARPKRRGTKHKIVLRCTDPHVLTQLPHLRTDIADPTIVATLRARSIEEPEFDVRLIGDRQARKMHHIGFSGGDIDALGRSSAAISRTIMHSDARGWGTDMIILIRSIVFAPWIRNPSLGAALVRNLKERISSDGTFGTFVAMRTTAIRNAEPSSQGKLVASLREAGDLLTPLPRHADLLWAAWGGDVAPSRDHDACLLDPGITLRNAADQRKRSSR